jgi:tetratricopeptide (TPR) repeat protein
MAVRPSRSISTLLGVVLLLGPFAAPAVAQSPVAQSTGGGHPAPPSPTPPEAAARAREHFQKGRDLYQAGSYREAIPELEAARELDPNAKDLVFNLGVVHEKLGNIDEALKFFKLYAAMDLQPAERGRAEAYIKRLEGAKHEVVVPTTTATATATVVPPPPPPIEPPPRSKGRAAATVVTASLAVAGFGVGIGFGVKALLDAPKTNFVTGPDGTYNQLANATRTSHEEAMVADIGFAVGVAATAVTAYLYFARPKAQSRRTAVSRVLSGAAMSGAPLAGGGVFVLRGSF